MIPAHTLPAECLSDSRRDFLKTTALAGLGLSLTNTLFSQTKSPKRKITRIGIIGLDTSHCEAFTKVINDSNAGPDYSGFRVTAAYPFGSRDIESSASRIPQITEDIKKYGVKITNSIGELLKETDAILLETNDGRLHKEQALQVISAGKPLFIDKPVSASLKDAIEIFDAAKKNNVPVFSSSSLRFAPVVQDIASGKKIGKVLGADTFTPCIIEKTHPDLFWYGIHGIEILYAILGRNCKQVVRSYQEETDVVTGIWQDGRIGSFRGTRNGKHDSGGRAYGENGNVTFSPEGGYEPLLKEIIKFFKTGRAPVDWQDTIEMFAFMEAADESKHQGGCPVLIDDIFKKIKQTP